MLETSSWTKEIIAVTINDCETLLIWNTIYLKIRGNLARSSCFLYMWSSVLVSLTMFLCKLWKLPAVNLNTTSPRTAYPLFRVVNMQSTFWSTSVLNFFKHWSYVSPMRPDSFDEKVSIFGCSFAFLWSFFSFFSEKLTHFRIFIFWNVSWKNQL